jgi:formamidopyrimidine-DNA glycosylase
VPELPDIHVYLKALNGRVVDRPLQRVRLVSPFLLRTAVPPLSAAEGKRVVETSRIGKRIVLALEEELFLVLHLMISGRLHWKAPGAKLAGNSSLAAFDWEHGTLTVTEASSKKRAALHVVRSREALQELDRGGVEPLEVSPEQFRGALLRENHTLKRSLTDPRLFSGIGNAYSDEILHRARLSPVKLTSRLTEDDTARLHSATVEVLREWIRRLEQETGEGFPERVTAFRPDMAVHGRYGQPCPACGSPVQRLVYAGNEANYCPTCQTEGKLLADRSLSRLFKSDWPRSLQELEEVKVRHRA